MNFENRLGLLVGLFDNEFLPGFEPLIFGNLGRHRESDRTPATELDEPSPI